MATPNTAEAPLTKRPLPSFVKKLWFILADEPSNEYIFWVDNGQVICVPNAPSFSKMILPKFFKHSNWQSFVRQLNLYGFRKVYQLNLSYDDSAEKRTVWQFKHECFRKGQPEKLCEIKRRASKGNQPQPTQPDSSSTSQAQYNTLNLNQADSIEQTLAIITRRLEHAEQKRKELRKQSVKLSQVQARQQKAIHVLMDFIMQFLEKHPESNEDKIRFDNIMQRIVEQQSIDEIIISDESEEDMMDEDEEEDEEEEDYDEDFSSSPLQAQPTIYPPQQLPSISSLMNEPAHHILPPLKRQNNRRH